jgi:hypothetical protein
MHSLQALKRITIQNTELWTPKGVLHPTRFYKELNVTGNPERKQQGRPPICDLPPNKLGF